MKSERSDVQIERIEQRRRGLAGLVAGLMLMTGLSASAQWIQTDGPVGVRTVGIVSEGNTTLLATVDGDIYRRYGAGWMRQGRLPEQGSLQEGRQEKVMVLQNGLLVAQYRGNIVRSVDLGITWEEIEMPDRTGGLMGDGETFYLFVDDPTFTNGSEMMKSVDGRTWTSEGTLPGFGVPPTFFNGAIYVAASYGTEIDY